MRCQISMETFDKLYTRASERKGGELALSSLISKPLSDTELCQVTNDRILSEMTKKIFQSGFVWSVVEKKWNSFEEVFWEFDIEKLIMMPDDMLERKATDPAIIRNYNKVKTIRENALMLKEISDEYGSVGKWLTVWSSENVIGLWAYLKKYFPKKKRKILIRDWQFPSSLFLTSCPRQLWAKVK